MKRFSLLTLLLETLVILGNLIVGITVLTYMAQYSPIDRVFIGSIILAIGVFGFTEFFSLRYAYKMRSIQSLVASILGIALGIVFIVLDLDVKLVCILWGSFNIAFSVINIITAGINMSHQPLLNGVRAIIAITEIVFSILLIIRTVDSLYVHMMVVGIALVVEAVTLFIEFLIHRYQR